MASEGPEDQYKSTGPGWFWLRFSCCRFCRFPAAGLPGGGVPGRLASARGYPKIPPKNKKAYFEGEREMNIKIKYLRDIDKIKTIDIGNWVDLRAAEDIELRAGEFRLIPLGVAMGLPYGYEAIVAPRSSTFKNFGILESNSIGIIDETYCGDSDEWFFPALAVRDTVIHKNDRICQFRILYHQPALEFEEVEKLGNANRGGHGSTGVQ